MKLLLRIAGLILALIVCQAPASADPVADTVTAVLNCEPGGPCAQTLPVRIVVVAMFEVGKDSGDAPGEFQLWKERRHLDSCFAFPQGYHALCYDPKTQILGMVTGEGSIRSAMAVMALGLDRRFDLARAYWLVAGIAGIDPHRASIGSVAWAKYLVDGDLAHEIDPREIPKDWKTGYFPLDRLGPNDRRAANPQGEMFAVNLGLTDWAYRLTRNLKLGDDAEIVAERSGYTGFPEAQRPPFVLEGDQLSAMTYWHGAMMNDWAHDWVDYWTAGKGQFVTSAMEDTGTYQSLDYLSRIGRADINRLLVLRAGSNFTMPPPGVSAAAHLLRENQGYAGMHAALEGLYSVGSVVIDELLAHWDRYAKVPPQ